jgi:hypothetical protein
MNEIEALAHEVARKREIANQAFDAMQEATSAERVASDELRDAWHRLRAAVDHLVENHEGVPA